MSFSNIAKTLSSPPLFSKTFPLQSEHIQQISLHSSSPSYTSGEMQRQSAHLHLSVALHLSHCSARTSSVMKQPHPVHGGTLGSDFPFSCTGSEAANPPALLILVLRADETVLLLPETTLQPLIFQSSLPRAKPINN